MSVRACLKLCRVANKGKTYHYTIAIIEKALGYTILSLCGIKFLKKSISIGYIQPTIIGPYSVDSMRREASFVNFEINVKYLDDDPKKVTFEMPILQMEMSQMKRNLIQTLEIDSQSPNYINPANLDLVLVFGDGKEDVLPNNERLENYHDQLSRCHLIKITNRKKSLTRTIGSSLIKVQDNGVCFYIMMAVIVVLLALCLALWSSH